VVRNRSPEVRGGTFRHHQNPFPFHYDTKEKEKRGDPAHPKRAKEPSAESNI